MMSKRGVLCGRMHLTSLATGKALCEEEPPVPDGVIDQTELTAQAFKA